MAGVRVQINRRAILAQMALQAGHKIELAAEIYVEEIQALIPDSPLPSSPGQPPNSPGPFRESFHSTPARRRGDSLIAWVFSLVMAGEVALATLLDRGNEFIAPRPLLREAERRAVPRINRLVAE